MNFQQLTIAVTGSLQESNIPYMLTGALAVSFYGRPRMTHDLDIVVLIRSEDVESLQAKFGEDFFVDDESIRAAIRERSMFNMIHRDTGYKVDFWMLRGDDYSRTAFERRRLETYEATRIYLASPEDVIVTKLDWYRMSDIDKHFADAQGVYEYQKGGLDSDYVSHWCEAKGLTEYWTRIRKGT